jgi:hypothetical protein
MYFCAGSGRSTLALLLVCSYGCAGSVSAFAVDSPRYLKRKVAHTSVAPRIYASAQYRNVVPRIVSITATGSVAHAGLPRIKTLTHTPATASFKTPKMLSQTAPSRVEAQRRLGLGSGSNELEMSDALHDVRDAAADEEGRPSHRAHSSAPNPEMSVG